MRYLLLAVVLSGCASPDTIGAKNAEIALQNFGAYCEKLGFKRGTEAFGNCIVQSSRK